MLDETNVKLTRLLHKVRLTNPSPYLTLPYSCKEHHSDNGDMSLCDFTSFFISIHLAFLRNSIPQETAFFLPDN